MQGVDASGLCVHALMCVTVNMSRLRLRSIRPVRRPADEILIMPADVSGVAQSVSAGWESLGDTHCS